MVRNRLFRFAFATAVVAAALALPPLAAAATTGVDIAGFAFSPQTVTVQVGDTVTWSNSDAQSHTATADDGSFDTGRISNGTSKSFTFSTAGTFGYHCKIHPQMTATVVVEAAAAPATDSANVTAPGAGSWPAAPLLLAVVFAAGVILSVRHLTRRSPTTEVPSA